MGRYVRPSVCLDCGAYVGVLTACRTCGLPQVGPDIELLRSTLERADELLSGIRITAAQASGGIAYAPPPPGPVLGYPPMVPVAPGQPVDVAPGSGRVPQMPPFPAASVKVPRRRWTPAISTSGVLLGLGALCFVVAVVVFISVAWSDLSLAARAAILLGVTAGLGAIAWWSVSRSLRASAETFSTLFTLLVTIDFVAAREGDLAGLGALSHRFEFWIAGLLLLGVGAGCGLLAFRSHLDALHGPQVLAVIGTALLSGNAIASLPIERMEFCAFVALIGLAAVVRLAGRLRVLEAGALSVAVLTMAYAVALSLADVATADSLHELWADGDGYGLLVCGLLALLATAVLPALWPRALAVAAALSAVATLVLRPVEGANADQVLLSFAAVTAGLTVVALLTRASWRAGARLAAALSGVATVGFLAPFCAVAIDKIVTLADRPWEFDPSAQPGPGAWTTEVQPIVGAGVLFAVLLIGVLLAVPSLPRVWYPTWAAVAASAAIVAGVLNTSVQVWLVVALLAAFGLGALTLAAARPELRRAMMLVAASYAGLSLVAALGAPLTTAVAAAGWALVLLLIATRSTEQIVSTATVCAAVLLAGLSAAAWVRLADGSAALQGVYVICVGALAGVAGQLRRPWDWSWLRPGAEAAAVTLGVVGLAAASEDSLMLQIGLTAAGAGVVLVSLISADRRRLSAAGGLLLAIATWVRLADHDVTLVEAYTLPSALVLLVVGSWYLRTDSSLSSAVAVGPGLSLALIPSLLRTLDEPTSLRALIVGLSGVFVLLVGAVLRLKAPLMVGGVVLAVIALINLGPLALALPRWVLFASIGVALLGLGLTWEKRLQELRALGAQLQRLR